MKKNLNLISVITILLGLLAIIFVQYFFKKPTLVGGVVLGNLLGLVSFLFLTKMIVKILDKNYTRKALMGVLLAVKFVGLIVIIGIGYKVLKIDVVGFALGYGTFVVAMMVGGAVKI